MARAPSAESPERRLRTVWIVGSAAILGAAVLRLLGTPAFQSYFGSLDPIVVTGLVVVAAVGALRFLASGDWLFVDQPLRGPRRFGLPVLSATVLAVPVVLVDLGGGFPEGINVLPPEALLFYPVIAVVAESVFHVVPVAGLIALTTRVLPIRRRETVLTLSLLLAAMPEPILQVVWGMGESPDWANAYVAVHLLLFNLLAVYLFLRNGFLSMLTFRLTYYLYWHIIWGVLRLRILF